MNRHKPTTADAAAIRNTAKVMGFKVRVAVTGWSLRFIGSVSDVRDVCVLHGITNVVGQSAAAPNTIPDYDGQTEFFGYVHV